MILQIQKFLPAHVGKDSPVIMRTDMLDGVTRTEQREGYVKVYFGEEVTRNYSRLEDDADGVYRISTVYLLNNEGKTLRRIV